MAREPVARTTIWKAAERGFRQTDDWVAVEEPLEIRVGGESLAVVMRTPGHDLELVAGFALTEGIVAGFDGIGGLAHCRDAGGGETNIVDVRLAGEARLDPARFRRNLMTSAACGLCGRASIEALAVQARPVEATTTVSREILQGLPERMMQAQPSFGRAGSLHAAALFDVGGSLRICREDVGRHNAVDKVIGRRLIDGAPFAATVLLVSGRTSFEILQKAAIAGIPIVAALSGPTTLAIETARAFNLTLVNFLRGRGLNIASVPARIVEP
jgi:FdhD protein